MHDGLQRRLLPTAALVTCLWTEAAASTDSNPMASISRLRFYFGGVNCLDEHGCLLHQQNAAAALKSCTLVAISLAETQWDRSRGGTRLDSQVGGWAGGAGVFLKALNCVASLANVVLRLDSPW